jgi:hypothetical protein
LDDVEIMKGRGMDVRGIKPKLAGETPALPGGSCPLMSNSQRPVPRAAYSFLAGTHEPVEPPWVEEHL